MATMKKKDLIDTLKEVNDEFDLVVQVNSGSYEEGNVMANVAIVKDIMVNKDNNTIYIIG